MSDIVETYERNGFTITIHYDPDCPSPREDESPGARLALFHRRYDFPNDPGLHTGYFSGWQAMADTLRIGHDALVIMAVWMLDHSGLAFRVAPLDTGNPFRDPWDSGQLGLAYVDRAIWQDTQDTAWTGSDEQIAQAQRLITSDVEQYGWYVNGDCYSYVITDEDGEEVDFCPGILGYKWVTEEANMSADHMKHVLKCKHARIVAFGQVVHDGPCPLHDPRQRLEALRAALRAETISYGELAELQSLAPHIDPGDTELLEAAGVPEHDDET